jgi:hypothetical protein
VTRQECKAAPSHIDRSGDLGALGPARQDGTGAGVKRVESFLLIVLAGDDDERRRRMAIAPVTELFARRRMRNHRVSTRLCSINRLTAAGSWVTLATV